MKKIFLVLVCISLALSQTIEVSAINFKGAEKELKATLSDNVSVKSEQGILKCELLVIFYDKNKKPIKYEASKNLNFDIKLKASHYSGVANKLIYTANDDKYTMLGDVYVKDKITNRDIKADKIIFNAKTGDYMISGKSQNEPVKFKFEMGNK